MAYNNQIFDPNVDHQNAPLVPWRGITANIFL